LLGTAVVEDLWIIQQHLSEFVMQSSAIQSPSEENLLAGHDDRGQEQARSQIRRCLAIGPENDGTYRHGHLTQARLRVFPAYFFITRTLHGSTDNSAKGIRIGICTYIDEWIQRRHAVVRDAAGASTPHGCMDLGTELLLQLWGF
jgi:hypothetical protein